MTDRPQRYRILGIPISIVSMDRVLAIFDRWLADRHDRYVIFRDVHGVMRAQSDPELRRAHEEADIIAPDGMPLVWIAKFDGMKEISRVCGPDLLPLVCQKGISNGWRHYFVGGAPGVAELMVENLTQSYPGISIVGHCCPPFRILSEEEDEIICTNIRLASPDFIWVGLGTPKQENWMYAHRGRCGGAIMLGVGAAFDLYAGTVTRAPVWMQKLGLEWLFRLSSEPGRLWRRYLILAPRFVLLTFYDVVAKRRRRTD